MQLIAYCFVGWRSDKNERSAARPELYWLGPWCRQPSVQPVRFVCQARSDRPRQESPWKRTFCRFHYSWNLGIWHFSSCTVTALTVVLCRLSVCHTPVLYQNGCMDLAVFCIETTHWQLIYSRWCKLFGIQEIFSTSLFVQVSNVLLALQAGSRGTQACINAASTVSGIIGDLDTTIMFATAGSLNADNEELFSDHRWINTSRSVLICTFIILATSNGKRDVIVWNLSVCLSCQHTHCDSPGGSMRCGQCTFQPNSKEDRQTC